MAQYKVPFLDGTNLLPTAKLGSGTADATKFLCGNQTWAAPTAGLPDIVYSSLISAGDITIAANKGGMIPGEFEISSGNVLELSSGGILEIM